VTESTRLQSIKRWFWREGSQSVASRESFTGLYEETYLVVFRYVYGLSGGPVQEVEDLTPETYARAWKTYPEFRGDGQAALGWLLRIARNLAIDLSRRRSTQDLDENVDIELLMGESLSPEMDVVTREQVAILWRMLRTLSEDVREMLVLRYMLQWKVKEIAAHLERNENTVTVTIQRTLRNLQLEWSQSQEKDHE
jgi:RNA polymerase sigma-70 factor, ECF subfamily